MSIATTSPYGNWYIRLETTTPSAPFKGIEPVSGIRGHYHWLSENGYKKHVACALAERLSKHSDITGSYAVLIQEKNI